MLIKITAIIPTFNEEDNIQQALNSVSFADEIIVIDSFSTDKTVDIVKQSSAKLLQREFDDFSSQKNYAIQQATHNWIFVLDADERVNFLLREEILKTVKEPRNKVGFYVRRIFYFSGEKINYTGYQRDKVVRLFNKKFCRYNGYLVHEVIEAKGDLGYLINKVDHFSFKNLDHFIQKLNHYALLQAYDLYKKGYKINIYHFTVKPIVRFFIHFVIRLGFLDGFKGLTLSYLHSYGVFMRYANLLELKKKSINKQSRN
ncbi:glycosyltransferase involved in cell wall biosynthesis [Tenacibaculum adriaticum]|uniref:Glycosyltransferase involved in cell wall biosynthesis n=1 Tax=Tenacibaculum adriaticum TaxID=413713 RepID=A0A5S5DSF2_9FLAO|nr:glycosyltransferase involved in cell wall biosynthesis [Tenacibaculum adriaticum]